jgi:hypothetical protein
VHQLDPGWAGSRGGSEQKFCHGVSN